MCLLGEGGPSLGHAYAVEPQKEERALQYLKQREGSIPPERMQVLLSTGEEVIAWVFPQGPDIDDNPRQIARMAINSERKVGNRGGVTYIRSAHEVGIRNGQITEILKEIEFLERWDSLKRQQTRCDECPFAEIDTGPRFLSLGDLPDPPVSCRVLFVGVAPTPRGTHFYSPVHDSLRSGLTRVLDALGYRLWAPTTEEFVSRFLAKGFYFLHSAKCPPTTGLSPHRRVIARCASHHLTKEVAALEPAAICFLGRNTISAAKKVAGIDSWRKVEVTTIGQQQVKVLITYQPVRNWIDLSQTDIQQLLKG